MVTPLPTWEQTYARSWAGLETGTESLVAVKLDGIGRKPLTGLAQLIPVLLA